MNESSYSRLKVTDKKLRGVLGPYDMTSLKFDPQSFVVESPKLESRIIESSVQVKSLSSFVTKPTRAMNYVVAGNPDDRKARYFAYYLAEIHQQQLGLKSDVRFETIVGNFENQLITKDATPTMLVISNLTVNSSNLKFEKCRDLLERFPSIPKVIVVAGEDPISFAATRLHIAVHGIAYFGNKISKMVNEVI